MITEYYIHAFIAKLGEIPDDSGLMSPGLIAKCKSFDGANARQFLASLLDEPAAEISEQIIGNIRLAVQLGGQQ